MFPTSTVTSSSSTNSKSTWHPTFLKMLPAIERHAQRAFSRLNGDTRDDAVQETICNACVAFARLVEQGREDAASPTSLATYAVAQFHEGRRVGSSLNVNDVCSVRCRRQKGVNVDALCSWDEEAGEWRDILIEDKNATPADLAASRIDVPAFFATLSPRNRRIAERLAIGESTKSTARLFGISPARISQLRQELKTAWERFHEPATVPANV